MSDTKKMTITVSAIVAAVISALCAAFHTGGVFP